MCGGSFEFVPDVRDLARFSLGTNEPEEFEMLQYMSLDRVDSMRKK
jgi:hypothetical protein